MPSQAARGTLVALPPRRREPARAHPGSSVFENLTWTHLAIIAAVGLLVFGPERLPGAIRWSVAALRQLRAQLTDATSGLREQFGPELDELREPLAELQRLRGMTPRAAIVRHLLDGDDTVPATSDRSPALPAVEPRHAAGSPPPASAPFDDGDAT